LGKSAAQGAGLPNGSAQIDEQNPSPHVPAAPPPGHPALEAGDDQDVLRFHTSTIVDMRYLAPVGAVGPLWFVRNFVLRYR